MPEQKKYEKDAPGPCSEGCTGWHHFSEPYEIQACVESGIFDKERFPDDAARALHKIECGCQWPDFDYQAAGFSWLESLEGLGTHHPRNLTQQDLEELEELLEGRDEEYMSKVDRAVALCANFFDKTYGKEQELVRGLLTMLKEVQRKIANEELKLKDFGSPPSASPATIKSIKKNMTEEEIVEAVEERIAMDGFENLDDAVHDAAQAMASDINNQGPGAQIRFLVEQVGLKEAQEAALDHYRCTDEDCPDAKTNPYHDHPNED